MSTKIRKGRDGWEVRTEIDLVLPFILSIRTSKASQGGVLTFASVMKLENGGESFIMFADFSERIVFDPAARCTSKTVQEQHARALQQMEDVRQKIGAFYAKSQHEDRKAVLGDPDVIAALAA